MLGPVHVKCVCRANNLLKIFVRFSGIPWVGYSALFSQRKNERFKGQLVLKDSLKNEQKRRNK